MFNEFLQVLNSGDIQAIFSNQFSQVILVAIGLILLVLVGKFAGTKKFEPKVLIFSALLMAMAFVLSQIKIYEMPYGGSISILRMFMVALIGYFFGLRAGFAGAIAYGLLELVAKPYVVHPVQLLLDYPLAFGALGLSGLFKEGEHALEKGFIVACFARMVFHFIAGLVFFAEYTPEGWNPVVYSLWYNASYIIPELIITLILLNIPAFRNAIFSVKKMLLNGKN